MVALLVAEHGLQSSGSAVVALSLDALQLMGSSSTRGEPSVPCTDRQTLNHWITREVQDYIFYI